MIKNKKNGFEKYDKFLNLYVNNFTFSEIADTMHVSRQYLYNIFSSLRKEYRVKSNTALVKEYILSKLVPTQKDVNFLIYTKKNK